MTASDNKTERLGEYLYKKGIISFEQLTKALKNQTMFGGTLGSSLLELGYITEDDLAYQLAVKKNIPTIKNASKLVPDKNCLKLFTAVYMVEHQFFPFKKTLDAIHVLMKDPSDQRLLSEISKTAKSTVKAYIIPSRTISNLLEKHLDVKKKDLSDKEYVTLQADSYEEDEFTYIKESEKLNKDENRELLSENDFNSLYKDRLIQEVPVNSRDPLEAPPIKSIYEAPENQNNKINYFLRKIQGSTTEAEIIMHLINFASFFFQRVVYFKIYKTIILGWESAGIDKNRILGIMVPPFENTIFKYILTTKEYFYGKIPTTPLNKRLFKAMGTIYPENSLLIPLKSRKTIIAVLYCDSLTKQEYFKFLNHLFFIAKSCSDKFDKELNFRGKNG